MADGLKLILTELEKDKKFQVPVMLMSNDNVLAKVPGYISSGFPALDIMLGGGYPIRRIIEIYGENSSGKSLLATYAGIAAERQDCMVVYADIEVALGIDRMAELGMDFNKCIYAAPDKIEDVMQLLERMIALKNKVYGVNKPLLFIFDSVAALATADELEADKYENKDYPRAAKYLSGAMRKLKNMVAANNVCLLLINQTRQRLGVLFGDGVITYGGEAIKFYSSIRIELQNLGKLTTGKGRDKEIHGINTKFTTVKNRLSRPYQSVTLPIYYDNRALDSAELMFNFLNEHNFLELNGAWYTLPFYEDDEVKFQSKDFETKVLDARWDDLLDLLEDEYGVELPYVYS